MTSENAIEIGAMQILIDQAKEMKLTHDYHLCKAATVIVIYHFMLKLWPCANGNFGIYTQDGMNRAPGPK